MHPYYINVLEDGFHFVLECSLYGALRRTFIPDPGVERTTPDPECMGSNPVGDEILLQYSQS